MQPDKTMKPEKTEFCKRLEPPQPYRFSERVRGTAVGIDIGTTYSRVAVWSDKHNRFEIIPNKQGNKSTPACVAWDGTQLLVGEAGKIPITTDSANNNVFDVKRLMEIRFNDGSVQKNNESWPFKVIIGEPAKRPVLVFKHESGDKRFTCERIHSMILKDLKDAAEAYLGTIVTHAVITVPENFNLYCPEEKNVVIFDMGGKRFDVSLVNLNKDGFISVKSSSGDPHMGGDDFDKLIVNHCVQEFREKKKRDVTKNAKAMMRLKVTCEKAKRDLSLTTQTFIQVDSLYEGIDFSIRLSREKFEELNAHYFKECIEHVKICLRDGKMNKKDVDDVIIVGGSTWIPKVQQMLMEFFDGKPLCKSINMDEGVAYGAAVLAANIGGKGKLVQDVTPISIGFRSEENDMCVVIPKKTPIPTIRNLFFLTETDKDERVGCTMKIDVYGGESCKPTENLSLGSILLDTIPGTSQKFNICFIIDANGTLTVSGEVVSTGCRKSITIGGSERLLKQGFESRGGTEG
ncbi:putative heat shock protein 70 family protein [Tanacetum coccineum]